MLKKHSTIIVGAGVIGCSLARYLARGGQRVTVIDRAAPGQEASHAAAGMLAPTAEAERPSPLYEFGVLSRAFYGPLATDLLAETGIDIHYRSEGTLLPYADAEGRDHALHGVAWARAQGARVEVLTAQQGADREPSLAGFVDRPAGGALFLPDDHQVDNRLLMEALVRSCRRYGVEFILGQPATRVLSREGRAVGVELGHAESRHAISADHVVNASGAWAAQLHADGCPALPLRPVKGHILALQTAPGTLRHVVRSTGVYLVPRHDGRIIVGATMEEAGFDKAVRVEPIAALLQAAQTVCPPLARAEWLDAWTGLRPATPDGLPIIGPLPSGRSPANYWAALGHFRNGILLAPATAQALGDWMLTGSPSLPLDGFLPDRFLR